MHRFIALILILFPILTFPINQDSLFKAIQHLPDTQKITILAEQSEKLISSHTQQAKELATASIELAKKTKIPYYKNLSYLSLAQCFFELGLADSSSNYLQEINMNPPYSAIDGKIFMLDGKINYTEGNYLLALQLFIQAQTIFDSLSIDLQGTKINIEIGNVYAQQGQFEKARNYYQRAFDLAILRNKPEIKASALNNLAIMYKKENKLDEALSYLKQALEIKTQLNMQKSVALTLSNIGDVHAEKNEFQEALHFHNKALKLKEELGDKIGVAHSYNRLGLVYNKMGKYYNALEVLTKAQEIYQQLDYPKGLQENYETMASVYHNMNMFKNAYEYQHKYSELTEKLFNEYSTHQISELQAKYENEKKNKEIALLQKEKELIETKVNRQRIVRFLLILSLFSSILIIFLFYNRARLKQNANQLLSKQNKEIKQKNEEIESQAEYLSTLNKELEKLSIVASKTDNAIMILDSKTNIEWVNEGFTRMYGYTLQEARENKNKGFIGSLSNLNVKDIVNIWYGDKKTISIEALNKTKSGDEIWSQSTITPITDNNRNVQYLVVIESDITALKKAGEEITRKSNELMSSIEYAQKIQQSFMPKTKNLQHLFKEHFVFHRPKDVVSGDFYWYAEVDKKLVFASADCTGHGVPGAFMSLIGINFLHQIIANEKTTNPDLILDRLRKNVSSSLNKFDGETITRDGMDISIITFDENMKKIQFSGAMSTMYIMRNKEIIEFSGDKKPIGFDEFMHEKYTLHNFDLKENDIIYMFTDGFPDQFGGKKNKKFKYSNFKELFRQIAHHPLNYQLELISNTYVEWKGINEQVDDILIIGLKI